MLNQACGICITSSWVVSELGTKICLCCYLTRTIEQLHETISSLHPENPVGVQAEVKRLHDIEKKYEMVLMDNARLQAKIALIGEVLPQMIAAAKNNTNPIAALLTGSNAEGV